MTIKSIKSRFTNKIRFSINGLSFNYGGTEVALKPLNQQLWVHILALLIFLLLKFRAQCEQNDPQISALELEGPGACRIKLYRLLFMEKEKLTDQFSPQLGLVKLREKQYFSSLRHFCSYFTEEMFMAQDSLVFFLFLKKGELVKFFRGDPWNNFWLLRILSKRAWP